MFNYITEHNKTCLTKIHSTELQTDTDLVIIILIKACATQKYSLIAIIGNEKLFFIYM